MEEIWKDIPGYEGKYKVSNLGNIVSYKTNKKCYFSDSKNYKRVLLYKNGKAFGYSVHRIVAQAFLPNPNNYPCVNHIDCDGSNNKVDNLEWCTYKENNDYRDGNIKRNIRFAINSIKGKYPDRTDLTDKLEDIIKELPH